MGGSKEQELLQIFLEEATDLIASLSAILREWENDLNNLAKVTDLKRDLHTLKGSARMVGQMAVGTLAHEMETLSEAMAKGEVKTDRVVFDKVVAGLDHISLMVEAIQQQKPPPPAEGLLQSFQQLLGGKASANSPTQAAAGSPEKAVAEKESTVEGKEGSKAAEVIRIRGSLLETLNQLSTENNLTRVGVEQRILNVGRYLRELKEELKRLESQASAFSLELQGYLTESLTTETSEVSQRYITLEQMSKVMRETILDASNTLKASQENYVEMESLILSQNRVGTELQHRLSDTRLVPFESIVPRLSRIARQVATELNKPIDFKVLKSEGEMDRMVLEHLVPSLEHILRNAIDHGIETAEERRKRGKPEVGKIEVSFTREGSMAAIEVKDDGAGIDSEAVRRKAVKLGFIPSDSPLTDQEVIRYILEPGFSTREAVTQVSGRGVGMDVVNTAVKSMGGSLNMSSERGAGTRMVVRFPFTTSLNRILLFELHSEIYGILLSSLEGITGMPVEEVKKLLATPNPIFQANGKPYYFHHLGALLGDQQEIYLPKKKTLPILLIPSTTYPMALGLDNVLYSRELLVQSLGAQFKLMNDCSGATLLGDGRLVLILDTEALAQKARNHPGNLAVKLAQGKKTVAGSATILLVDDSASARAVAKRLLEKQHYQVVMAKDGLDALQQLETVTPQIFLLDIDMPRMDGLELASVLREDKRFKHIPIVMLTALANSERRQQAKEMKIESFIEKPFEETQLLLTIQSLLGKSS